MLKMFKKLNRGGRNSMKKIKKLTGFIFTLLITSIFINAYGASENAGISAVKLSDTQPLQENQGGFSSEETEKIKILIKEEFNKFYEKKSKKNNIEEIAALNQKLGKEKKRCSHYKNKLHAKKDYISPKELKNEIDKVKLNLILEYNRYLNDYINKSENKDKKVKQLDLNKIFSNLISLNFTFNNPKEVNLNPTLIKGEARGTIAGAAVGI